MKTGTIPAGRAVLFLLFILSAGCAGTETSDPGRPVTVRAGKTFSVRIASNPSTGYYWDLAAAPDPLYLEFIKKEYKPSTRLPAAGAGGTDIFHFRALQAGTTRIILAQYHPYDRNKENPVLTLEYTVIIQQD